MAGTFDSAWLKFGWANRHGRRLMEEIERFFQSGPEFQEEITYDSEARELVLSVASIEPVPSIISLTLADALGCFRQCLDHVAWEMVQRGTDPIKRPHFVIVDHANAFENAMLGNMPGVSGGDRKVVEGLNGHIWNAADPLKAAILRMQRLNNHDKHRTIRAVNTIPRSLGICGELQDCTNAGSFRVVGDKELVAGVEFVRIPVNMTGPNPTIRSSGRIQTIQSIDGIPVADLVNAVADTIQYLVLDKLQPNPPAEVYRLGADLKPASG